MAFEILNLLVKFLSINCSFVNCYQYPSELHALFFVFFFPTVVLILFVYVLTTSISNSLTGNYHSAIFLLLSAALYIYIVLQGLFNIFVVLSTTYFIVIILVVGPILFLITHILGRGGGGRGGPFSAPKDVRDILTPIIGDKEINPLTILGNRKLIDDKLRILHDQEKTLRDELSLADREDQEHIKAQIGRIKTAIAELKRVKKDNLRYKR